MLNFEMKYYMGKNIELNIQAQNYAHPDIFLQP